jgi:hypothetical protein
MKLWNGALPGRAAPRARFIFDLRLDVNDREPLVIGLEPPYRRGSVRSSEID